MPDALIDAAPAAGIDLATESDVRDMLRRFLDDVAPPSATRAFVEGNGGYRPELWRRVSDELQVVGLSIPVEQGGDGLAPVLSGIVFAEFGRSLVPSPLLGTCGLAVPTLVALGTADANEHLAPLIAGTATATLGWVGGEQSWDPASTPVRLIRSADGWAVTGSLTAVVDAEYADVLLVVARTEQDLLRVVAVDPSAAGVTVASQQSVDLTRRLGSVGLTGTPAIPIGPEDAASAIRLGLLSAAALLAVESAGAARRALELTVDYAKIRHQFGRSIGSFQAVKHRCADMLSKVELMEALALDAVREVGYGGLAAAESVHAAQAFASDAFCWVAAEMVQLHGGIGFTWEHDAQLYFRRSQSSALLLGTAAEHRAAIAHKRGWQL